MSKFRIPKFKNYQEEAHFWDVHSIADFKDELRKVDMKVKKPLKVTFSLRLDPKTIGKLDKVARKKGIGPATLARMWILEELNKPSL